MWKYLIPAFCILLLQGIYLGMRQNHGETSDSWQSWTCSDGRLLHWRMLDTGTGGAVQARFDKENAVYQLKTHYSPLFDGTTYTNGTLMVYGITAKQLAVIHASDPTKPTICRSDNSDNSGPDYDR